MDFLSYLRKKDNNRRRKKKFVIYTLYLLIPTFLFASTFTNERIITKCENIYEEKVVYEQIIKEKDVEISRLKGDFSSQVDSLSDHLATTETNCETSLLVANNRIEALLATIAELEKQNADKDQTINRLEQEVAQKDGYIQELEKDLEAKADQIRQLENSLRQKDAEITDLSNQLRTCNAERASALKDRNAWEEKYNNMRSERDRYQKLYEDAQNKFAACDREKAKLQRAKDSCEKNYSDLKRRYDRLLEAGSSVNIRLAPENSSVKDPMTLKNNQVYQVIVNGKVVRYIRGGICIC